jgi:hypothetical protein
MISLQIDGETMKNFIKIILILSIQSLYCSQADKKEQIDADSKQRAHIISELQSIGIFA